MEEADVKHLYQENFQSEVYVKQYYSERKDFHEFFLKNIHTVFSQGDLQDGTCIEIGCGPTVHSIASASKYCSKIITSDFLEGNREQVKLWLKRDPKAIDWSHIFKIVSELEGFKNIEEGVSEIEERVRRKVTDVLYCDVWQEYPLEKQVDQCDILITCLALEGATEKTEDYSAAVRNICHLLKSGGKIIVIGTLHCTFYVVNETKFPSAYLTRDLVDSTLQSAGCKIESFEEMMDTQIPLEMSNGQNLFFCLAVKK